MELNFRAVMRFVTSAFLLLFVTRSCESEEMAHFQAPDK